MMIRLVRGKLIGGITKDFSSDPKSGSAFGYLVRPFGNAVQPFGYLVRPFGYPVQSFGYPVQPFVNRGMAFGYLV